jgi:hypothetical protein
MSQPANPGLLARIDSIRWQPLDGYLVGTMDGRRVSQHRLLWEAWFGPIPPRHVIHHVNHDRADNRIENLRLMTATEHGELHGRENRVRTYTPRGKKPHPAGVCKVCRSAKPMVLMGRVFDCCVGCSAARAIRYYKKTAKKWWMADPGRRKCTRCGQLVRCRHGKGVCEVCIDRHLDGCPEVARLGDWTRIAAADEPMPAAVNK